jgi:hypothetical protein
MIDLRVWLYALLGTHDFVATKGSIISTVLAAVYVALLARARPTDRVGGDKRDDQLLPLAALAALTLLPVYHKLYDAVLLVLALAWALRALRDPRLRGVAGATLAALAIFLIPFDFLPLLMKRTAVLDGVAQTWLWRVVIFPHHALATLAVAFCVLYAFYRRVRQAKPRLAQVVAEPHAELAELVSAQS